MTHKMRNAVDDLIAQGLAEIESGFTFAKAAQPEAERDDDDLDGDFAALDKARAASEQATQQPAPGNQAAPAPSDDDEDEDDLDDLDDDEDEEGGEGQGGQMAKAVNAWPLLQALDAKLELLPVLAQRVERLEAQNATLVEQNATLAKAVQEGARGSHTMAKAVAAALGQPALPKSKLARAQVPVSAQQASGLDRNTVMSKAVAAVERGVLDVEAVATLEVLTNSVGVDAAVAQMPAIQSVLNS